MPNFPLNETETVMSFWRERQRPIESRDAIASLPLRSSMTTKNMKTAMAFGTFDILHPGHINFLKQAKIYGNLIVIIARDRTVKQVKGKLPKDNEKQRLKAVLSLNLADIAVIGSLGNKYAVIKKYRPDIICLGYDQLHFIDRLDDEIKNLNLKTKIIRLKSYKPTVYKSSKL